MRNKKILFILLLSLLLLSLCLTGCGAPSDDDSKNGNNNIPTVLTSDEIYNNVSNSLVNVSIKTLDQTTQFGNGFFIDNNGTFITNYHVIEHGVSGKVKTKDGTTYDVVNLIGYNDNSDIAILSTTAKNTSPVSFGSINDVNESDSVYIIDQQSSSIKSGVVLKTIIINAGKIYIQTDINIVNENSGSPLINQFGKVIGIATSNITLYNKVHMDFSTSTSYIDNIDRDINESLLIHTKRQQSYTINLYLDDVKQKTLIVNYESTIELPEFLNGKKVEWYSDSTLENKFDINTKITDDTNIYAKRIYLNIEKGVVVKCDKDAKNIEIPDNYDGYKITTIGKSCFKNLNDLESVIIPDTVTCIDKEAFYGCSKLTSIILPSNLQTIESYAFYDAKFTSIKLPDTIKYIGTYAFNNNKLESVSIPDSVTGIGEGAFECDTLKKVYITDLSAWCNIKFESGIDPLLAHADLYLNDKLVTDLIIPDGITSIGDYAFTSYDRLTSITIPSSVSNIGIGTFDNVYFKNANIPAFAIKHITNKKHTLKTIIINSGDRISNSALAGQYLLNSVKISDSVTSIGMYAFYNTPWYDNQPDGLVYAGKVAYRYKGKMPSNTQITLKSDTRGLADYVFYNCTGLTEITLPNSVINIGEFAFNACYSLNNVIMSNSIKSIGENAFCDCNNLENIILPETVVDIGPNAFRNTNLNSVLIPNSVTSIGYSAFAGCNNLQRIEVRENNPIYKSDGNCLLTKDGKILILGCKSSVIPLGITKIEDYAFDNCNGLTSITNLNGITSIGNYAFRNCNGLKTIELPDSITTIGGHAFEGCTSLYSVILSKKITNIDVSTFENCMSLFNIKIPSGVTSIGESAFANSNLTTITIPDGVTKISRCAFYNCRNLTSIKIPSSTIYIGDDAFGYCYSLTLYCEALSKPSEWFGSLPPIVWNYKNNNTADDGYIYVIQNGIRYALKDNKATVAIQPGQLVIAYLLTSFVYNEDYYEVTSIADHAFYYCNNFSTVLISHYIKNVGRQAFPGDRPVKEVYYEGTQEEWNMISIDTYNDGFINPINRYYYSESEPKLNDQGNAYIGKYWHYNADLTGPIIWAK